MPRIILVVTAVLGLAAGGLLLFRSELPTPLGTQDARPVIDENAPTPAPPTDEDVAKGIALGTDFLLRHLGDDGRFVYRINVSGRKPPPKYNTLRHAGSVYALHAVQQRAPVAGAEKGIVTAATYMRERYVRPVARAPGALAVFSRPDEESLKSGEQEAKLGGAALGLLALLAGRNYDPAVAEMDTLRGLGNFILFMQRDDGSFRSKYNESDGFLQFNSLYYPGEAILALTELYLVDKDPRWLDGALRAVAQLVQSRKGARWIPNDHWLMIACERLLPSYDDAKEPPISRADIEQHVWDLAKAMLDEQKKVAGRGALHGSFVGDGRSTPSATRLEGLYAAWRIFRTSHPDRAKALHDSLGPGIGFLLRCQLQDGPGKGGVLRALAPVPAKDDNFNARQTEIRIDYVQHALSAMIGLEVMRGRAPQKAAPAPTAGSDGPSAEPAAAAPAR